MRFHRKRIQAFKAKPKLQNLWKPSNRKKQKLKPIRIFSLNNKKYNKILHQLHLPSTSSHAILLNQSNMNTLNKNMISSIQKEPS